LTKHNRKKKKSKSCKEKTELEEKLQIKEDRPEERKLHTSKNEKGKN